MWEKLSDYCLDVSKYFLTGVFVTSMITDLKDVRWLIYLLSALIAAILLLAGLYFSEKSKKQRKKKGERS